jgi:molybdate transport system ATP-binding protein
MGGDPQLDLDFELPLGAFELHITLRTARRAVALVGPSGAGKTTCLRVLAGLTRPSRGQVRACGELWFDAEQGIHVPPWKRGVGWVPQEAMLFPHRTVRANLGYARGAAHSELQTTAEWLGIQHLLGRRPRNLSGGERQRVALGRALLSRPRLLLLDEPFAAVDQELRTTLARDLRAHCEAAGLPMVLVTHDTADVTTLADEVWPLQNGRIAEQAVGASQWQRRSVP